jgi:hypothetical protein
VIEQGSMASDYSCAYFQCRRAVCNPMQSVIESKLVALFTFFAQLDQTFSAIGFVVIFSEFL